MKIVFLRSSVEDLSWFRNYYSSIFPEGEIKAQQHFLNVCQLLEANPYMGRRGEVPGIREMHIPKTPFTLIYRVSRHHLEVLRLWDERQGPFD